MFAETVQRDKRKRRKVKEARVNKIERKRERKIIIGKKKEGFEKKRTIHESYLDHFVLRMAVPN